MFFKNKKSKNNTVTEKSVNKKDDGCIDVVINPPISHKDYVQDEVFDNWMDEAWAALPPNFKNRLNNVHVQIFDEPLPEQLKNIPDNSELLGLYVGHSLTTRENYGFMNLPDNIYIFAKPIQRVSVSVEAARDQVRRTLLHEVGHYFGMTDEELRARGY